MIIELQERHLVEVAKLHLYAWKKGFKNILSHDLLSSLSQSEFEKIWIKNFEKTHRTNIVWVDRENIPRAFISYGPIKSDLFNEIELLGLYVHPDYWRHGIGKKLIHHMINQLQKQSLIQRIFLWTMTENKPAIRFYENVGFIRNELRRISQRGDDSFEEIQLELFLE